jgi:uncharacterized protein (DUF1501 family)
MPAGHHHGADAPCPRLVEDPPGGAVAGGRVAGDWPGLAPEQRFEGRDLRTTTDARALFKGVLRDHLGLDRADLDRFVFPGSGAVKPIDGLIRG